MADQSSNDANGRNDSSSGGLGGVPHSDRLDTCQLSQFSRNRYFHGKLMTARDMEQEQHYNVGRLNTFARTLAGQGIVCGLGVTVEDDEGAMLVRVESGYALDSCGHPVVVAADTTASFSPQDREQAATAGDGVIQSDEFSLYLSYEECWTEQVPISGSENACGEDCTYNRVVETYDVEIRRGVPDSPKPVYDVDFPTSDDFDTDAGGKETDEHDPALHEIATSYNETDNGPRTQRSCDGSGDGLVYLGSYEQSGSDWVPVEDVPRSHVYDNDMLYAAIARHATNFDNPHEVVASILGVEPDDGDVGLTSESGTITYDSDEDGSEISIDLDEDLELKIGTAIQRISNVEADEDGNVDLDAESDVISVETDPSSNSISIDFDEDLEARIHEAISSIHGVTPDEDGEVELTSDSNTITFDTDSNAISVDIAEDYQGGGITISQVEPDGRSNIDILSVAEALRRDQDPGFDDPFSGLASQTDVSGDSIIGSQTEFITVLPQEEKNRVVIGLAPEFREQLTATQSRLRQHDLYVMDKTLKYTVESFYKVAYWYRENYDVSKRSFLIMKAASEGVEKRIHESDEDYYDIVDMVADEAVGIRDWIQTKKFATPRSFGRYNGAVDELDELLDATDGDSVTRAELMKITVALDWVCETAGWLRPREETILLPGGQETSSSVISDLARRSGYPLINHEDDGNEKLLQQFATVVEDVETEDEPADDETADDDRTLSRSLSTESLDIVGTSFGSVPLSEVEGIGSAREEQLREADITSAEELVAAETEEVASQTGLSEGVVEKLQQSGEAELQG